MSAPWPPSALDVNDHLGMNGDCRNASRQVKTAKQIKAGKVLAEQQLHFASLCFSKSAAGLATDGQAGYDCRRSHREVLLSHENCVSVGGVF